MFDPPLDLGNDWEDVELFSVEPNRFNYQRNISLDFRADALLIKVSTSVANAEDKFGGELFQFWETSNARYQVVYSKLWFNNQNIVAIEPLERSKLLYRPPAYLYNWTIDVKARPYTPQDNTLLLQIIGNQQRILEQLLDVTVVTGMSASEPEGRFFISN